MNKSRAFLAIFLMIVLLAGGTGCGRIVTDVDDNNDDEISSHTLESSETPSPTPEDVKPEIRKSLTDDQIESIAFDLAETLSLFYEGPVVIDRDQAEFFSLCLAFSGPEKVEALYVSQLDNLIDREKTFIKNRKVDGDYVRALSNAIFGVDFDPEDYYEFPMGDPAPFGIDLLSVEESKGQYDAIISLLDIGGSCFATMDLKLHLTEEGNTRIDSIVISQSVEPEAIENRDGVLTRQALESQYYDLHEYDFDEDGLMELVGSKYDGYAQQQLVFAKHEGGYVLIFNESYMEQWNDYLTYDLKGQTLTWRSKDQEKETVCVLPDRLFCHKEKESDDLHLIKESTIVTVGEKPAVLCSLKLCMPIGGGDYGPSYSEYLTHYCDLIRVDLLLQYNGGKWESVSVDTHVKYGTDKESALPVRWDEFYLGDHTIEDGGDVRETIVRLGGKVEDYDSDILDGYKESIQVGGVHIDLFLGGMICGFSTCSPPYPTSRGLMVCDTRETVRMLYGEPDKGFLDGDGGVFYYMCSGDSLEEMQYVSSKEFYVLFDGDMVSCIGFTQFCTD